MANDLDEGHDRDEEGPSSASEARAALNELDRDRASLATRVVTPWWYHPILGVITVAFAGAQALPGAWPLAVITAGIIALPVLTTTYSHRYGVAVTRPAGPRSRRLLFVVGGVLIVGMASSLAIKFTGLEPWWVVIPAVITLVSTITLGRRYDDALRSEIAAPGGAQS